PVHVWSRISDLGCRVLLYFRLAVVPVAALRCKRAPRAEVRGPRSNGPTHEPDSNLRFVVARIIAADCSPLLATVRRLFDWIKALFNRAMDKVEDPDIMLDQARRDMQAGLIANREKAVQAITQKNRPQ